MSLNHTLSSHFETLFKPHKLTLSAPSTVYQYRLNLRRFDEYLDRPAMVPDLQDSVIAECMNWMLRTKRLSPASISKFRDNLCCLWRFLARKRIVDTDPDVVEIKEPFRAPIALTKEELLRLWEYLLRLPGRISGIEASDWFCSLVACFWDTGARKGELFQLRWPDVDLNRGFIRPRAQTVKGGLEEKLYRIRPSTVEWLSRIVRPVRDQVWPWPWSETIFYDKLGQIMLANGLPDDRRHKTHIFRKSVATHLLLAGGDPTQALGHSSSAITERYYLDRSIAPRPSPIDRLFPLDGDPDPPRAA